MKEHVREGFEPLAERMRAEGLPDLAIRTFAHYYGLLRQGESGLIPEATLTPVTTAPDAAELGTFAGAGRAALPHTVMVKLNGGLGTSMGLEAAKSLLPVKNGLTFLDIIARQALHAGVPLLLMNSFNTHDDSLAALRAYPELWGDLPLDFLQHKVPKVDQQTLGPAQWPQNPQLEWCPPGHGDIYTALVTSGMLDRLLEAGIVYAFVSNSDNLGAVLDEALLGYFAERSLPFMMEVTDRTPADRKGGPLVRTADGRFTLWEASLCPPEDMPSFSDIGRHPFFNTNNLWLNLPALKQTLQERDYVLGLPMIRSSKTVDPRDPESPAVYQLETAMGSGIGAFDGAEAIRVPRTRFAPVKTTDDLLGVRSDAYVLTEDWHVELNPARRHGQIVIALDGRFYRLIDAMEARFPHGAPSLVECERLTVRGDVMFGRDVRCVGTVEIANEDPEQMCIADGSVIGSEGESNV